MIKFIDFLNESIYIDDNGKAVYDKNKAAVKLSDIQTIEPRTGKQWAEKEVEGVTVRSLYSSNKERGETYKLFKEQNPPHEFYVDSAKRLLNMLKNTQGKILKNYIIVMPKSSKDIVRNLTKEVIKLFEIEAHKHSGTIQVFYDTFLKDDVIYTENKEELKDKDDDFKDYVRKIIRDANKYNTPVKSIPKKLYRFINVNVKANENYMYDYDENNNKKLSLNDLQYSNVIIYDDSISSNMTMTSLIKVLKFYYNIKTEQIFAYTLFNSQDIRRNQLPTDLR